MSKDEILARVENLIKHQVSLEKYIDYYSLRDNIENLMGYDPMFNDLTYDGEYVQGAIDHLVKRKELVKIVCSNSRLRISLIFPKDFTIEAV